MPGFLELPFEIRSMIIHFTIHAESDHPTRYSEAESRKRRGGADTGRWRNSCLGHERDPNAYVTSSYGLLGTSKQLNLETKRLLDKEPTVYKMDIGIMEARVLWPIWTCLPKKTTTVDLLEATFQARGPRTACFLSWHNGYGGHPHCVWWFYYLLVHFHQFGVQGPPTDPDSEPEGGFVDERKASEQQNRELHIIRVLDLNFVEPDESYKNLEPLESSTMPSNGNPEPHDCTHCGHDCRLPSSEHIDFSAVRLKEWLGGQIDTMLRCVGGFRTVSGNPQGRVLYEIIGKIRFRENGRLKSELNLTDKLLKLPNYYRGKDISQWRKQTIRVSKTRGLDVPGEDTPTN